MPEFDTLFVAAAALLFVAVFLAVEGLYLWWRSRHGAAARNLERRLKTLTGEGQDARDAQSLLKRRMLSNSPAVAQWLARVPRIGSLDRFVAQSGADWTVGTLLGLSGGLLVAGALVTQVLRLPTLPSVLIAGVLGLVPFNWLSYLRAKRLARFDELLPDALDLIGRALRAGHSFPSALQMAGAELPEPIGEEFQQTFDEVNFGVALPEAMTHLAERVPSLDLKFFVIAVLIQRETGGNLSEVLGNISGIIRDRIKLFGQVRVLTAESRISGWVLALLPFVMTAFLWLINPTFMSRLWTHPTGRSLLATGLTMMVIGILWMRRIIRIRV
jgi:tight adherence protein B